MSKSGLEELFDAHWRNHHSAGMPDPLPEQSGLVKGRKFRADRYWPSARLVVEIDGGQHVAGGGRHNQDNDREKVNLLTIAGYRVLRYSGDMIRNDPLKMIAQIEEVLTQDIHIYVGNWNLHPERQEE